MEKWESVTGYRCSAYQCGYVEYDSPLPAECPNCGAAMMKICPKCRGSGKVRDSDNEYAVTYLVCWICDGEGWVPVE